MTDQTQEAMRESYRQHGWGAYVTVSDRPLRQIGFEAGWQAATAQSAEKIARLEEENHTLTHAVQFTQTVCDELEQILAAAELSNKQFMVALESLRHIMRTIADRQYPALNLVTQQAMGILDWYLAQQPSTEALDAYVAGKMKNAIGEFVARQQSLPPEFQKVLNNNFWELLDDSPLPPTPEKG